MGDIGYFKGGSTFPLACQSELTGDYAFFKVSDMNNEENAIFMSSARNYISEDVRKKIGAVKFPKESIVIAKIGAAIFFERKKILKSESCIDNNMSAFILNNLNTNYMFLYYFLHSIKLGNMVATTALPSLSNSVLSDIEIQLPKYLEQTAIATVLTDMDQEIAALEAKLAKARAVKSGMMQELLTGRIRLI